MLYVGCRARLPVGSPLRLSNPSRPRKEIMDPGNLLDVLDLYAVSKVRGICLKAKAPYPADISGGFLLKNTSMFDSLLDQPFLDAHVWLGLHPQACAELLLSFAKQMEVCGVVIVYRKRCTSIQPVFLDTIGARSGGHGGNGILVSKRCGRELWGSERIDRRRLHRRCCLRISVRDSIERHELVAKNFAL
jgi:hypothetical protein